jgi:hypothetical protein
MLLIDVDKLIDSPLAREEGWQAELEHSFSTGLVILAPQSSTKSEANPKLQCQRLETRSQDRVREDRQE